MAEREVKKIVISGGTEKHKLILESLGMSCELFECDDLPDMYGKELSNEMVLQEIANYRGRKTAKQMIGRNHYNFIIISVESAVIHNNKVLKVPKTRAQAIRILKSLSGNTHKVVTGLCVWWGNKGVTVSDETHVKFRKLSTEEIEEYVDSQDWSHKGGYDISGAGAAFVESIEGSYYNILGIPINKLYEVVEEEYLFKLCAETECGVWNTGRKIWKS